MISNVKTGNRPQWDPKRKLPLHQTLHLSHNQPSKTPILELRQFVRVGMNAIELLSQKVNKTGDIQKNPEVALLKLTFGRLCDFQCQNRK